MTQFFELLWIALGRKDSFDVPPTDAQWDALLDMAVKHSIVGVTYCAIDKVRLQQRVPLRVSAQWALAMEKVKQYNVRQREVLLHLSQKLSSDGKQACLLKGQGNSLYYPEPLLRQSGDLDVWIPGPHRQTVAYLRSWTNVREAIYHHADIDRFEKIPVEIHFTPSWMNGYFANRRLQRYFSQNSQVQMNNFSEDLGVSVPEVEFNAVYNMIHIYRHLLLEGIGLRQLLDYHYILKALPPEKKPVVLSTLQGFGIRRFVPALMYVLGTAFGLEEEYMLCPADVKDGQFLLEEVMRAGNFGKYDPLNHYSRKESLPKRILHRTQHLSRYWRLASHEVLAAPFFKAWQYLWRLSNGYL